MPHIPRHATPCARKHLAVAISAALASIAPSAAFAQNVQEITVTAQKRAQPLQEVPIAVTALTAQDIQNRELEDVSDLSGLAPNLMVSKTPGNSTASQIAIRGGVTTNPALFPGRAPALRTGNSRKHQETHRPGRNAAAGWR